MSARLLAEVQRRHKAENERTPTRNMFVKLHVGQEIFKGWITKIDPAGGYVELSRDRNDGGLILIEMDRIVAVMPNW
jgi:hypothetical protein